MSDSFDKRRYIGGNTTRYEKVQIDEWISGIIVDVEFRTNKEKKYFDKDSGETKTRTAEELKIIIDLQGYEYKKSTPWMTISTHPKSKLFGVLRGIDPTFAENGKTDILSLINLPVKLMYDEAPNKSGEGMWQSISKIKPIAAIKLSPPDNQGSDTNANVIEPPTEKEVITEDIPKEEQEKETQKGLINTETNDDDVPF